MGTPTMPAFFMSRNRKDLMEQAIVRRREKEAQRLQTWNNVSKHFHDLDVKAAKYQELETMKSNPEKSHNTESGIFDKIKEARANSLRERRARLTAMLRAENEAFEEEMKKIRAAKQQQDPWGLTDLKQRLDDLKQKREEENKQTAEKKLYQRWRNNNVPLRDAESALLEEYVHQEWSKQLDNKKQEVIRAKEEEERLLARLEQQRQQALREAEEVEKRRRDEAKLWSEQLKLQIEDLKKQEAETDKLRKEEGQLLEFQRCIEAIQNKRLEVEEARKRREISIALTRQSNHRLRRKAIEVQQDLELDKQVLEFLAKEEAQQRKVDEMRRTKARADIEFMHQMVKEQLQLEKAREAEFQLLYQEEAEHIWKMQEAEWAKENEARKKLIEEVIQGLHAQLQEKVEQNRQSQKETLERRRQMLRELEEANHNTAESKKSVRLAQEQLSQDLQKQMAEKRHSAEEAKRAEEIQAHARQEEAAKEEERVRTEIERLHSAPWRPKDYRRRKAWM